MTNETYMITLESESRLSRLMNAMFPRTPDFYRLLNDQCNLVADAMDVFVSFMETGDTDKAKEVLRLEHEGDKLKAKNIDALNRSFSTPFDREDIYRAITTIDEGLNYAKTTLNEMKILGVKPDKYMLDMARFLDQGAKALQSGFLKVKMTPLDAEREAAAVCKSERQAKKVYRKAISELFDQKNYTQALIVRRKEVDDDLLPLLEPMEQEQQECTAVLRGLSFVMAALKQREVYRHISNASDHMAHAADILHDMVVKTV